MYWLDVRDCPATFWAFCDHFANRAAASFEGKLDRFDLLSIPGAASAQTVTLLRQHAQQDDFVVVPVTTSTIGELKRRLAGPRVFGAHGDIDHAQLSGEGGLLFSACDHFHRECVRATDLVPVGLLDSLVAAGLVRSYQVIPDRTHL